MKLSIAQQDRLDECELAITQHQEGFLIVAEALTEIKEAKLWKATHASFEEYCEKRWKWTSHRVRQLIRGAEIQHELENDASKNGTMVPLLNERSTRELARVPRTRRLQVVASASTDGKPPSSGAIREAAKQDQAKPAPQKDVEIELDKTGYPIPEARIPLWNRSEEVQVMLRQISEIRASIKRFMDAASDGRGDILFKRTSLSSVHKSLCDAYNDLNTAVPYAVCPDCQGHRADTCMTCKGLGLLSKYHWNQVSDDAKKLRELSVKK